jgi:hypothetical protein
MYLDTPTHTHLFKSSYRKPFKPLGLWLIVGLRKYLSPQCISTSLKLTKQFNLAHFMEPSRKQYEVKGLIKM